MPCSKTPNNVLRILTALVLIGLLAAVLWLHPGVFAAFAAAAALLAWREFAELAAQAGARPLRGAGPVLAVACTLAFVDPDPLVPWLVVTTAVLLSALGGLAAGRRHPALAVRRTMATAGGILWLGVLPGFHVALRFRPDGVYWIVLLYAAVSGGDIAAYYGGRAFGRHALAPALSPKKTVEGTVFGLAASVVAALLVDGHVGSRIGPLVAALTGLGLGVVGQAGDLFESSLKRAADTKDSSGLLPGHGGVLDRIDGLLFAGAALWALLAAGVIRA